MSASSGACASEAGSPAVSRFKPGVVAETAWYYDRNAELGRTAAVKRCVRADGTAGVAVVARGLMVVFTAAEAVAVADGLVDAVEAIEEMENEG